MDYREKSLPDTDDFLLIELFGMNLSVFYIKKYKHLYQENVLETVVSVSSILISP